MVEDDAVVENGSLVVPKPGARSRRDAGHTEVGRDAGVVVAVNATTPVGTSQRTARNASNIVATNNGEPTENALVDKVLVMGMFRVPSVDEMVLGRRQMQKSPFLVSWLSKTTLPPENL